jgi:hypothetical protein
MSASILLHGRPILWRRCVGVSSAHSGTAQNSAVAVLPIHCYMLGLCESAHSVFDCSDVGAVKHE